MQDNTKRKILLILLTGVLLLTSGCAPFTFDYTRNDNDGYTFTMNGKLPRGTHFEHKLDGQESVVFDTDSKVTLIPSMNLSAINLGAATSVTE